MLSLLPFFSKLFYHNFHHNFHPQIIRDANLSDKQCLVVLGKLRLHWRGIPPYITKALVEAKRKLTGFYTLVSLVNFW